MATSISMGLEATDLSLDWNVFVDNSDSDVKQIGDALVLSVKNCGGVDISYIATKSGYSKNAVIEKLKGAIYQNPETWNQNPYEGWELSSEYLSGNIREKYHDAVFENKLFPGQFSYNIEVLESLMPKIARVEGFYATLGSPWVPTSIMQDFVEYLIGFNEYVFCGFASVKFDEVTATWEFAYKSSYDHNPNNYSVYGTRRMPAIEIIERSCNMREVAVYDEIDWPSSKTGKRRVLNKEETAKALDKQKKILKVWKEFIKRADVKSKLNSAFDNKYGYFRKCRFDGSFLDFPGMSSEIQLYDYQKNAVARMLFKKNTLLAHDVGSGKTYEMVAAIMESKRMGLTHKALIVVPNNIISQWEETFLTMYPQAKVFCVVPKKFTPTKRDDVLELIKNEDFDAVIMACSCFDMIEVSKDYSLNQMRKKIEELKELLDDDARAKGGIKKEIKRLDDEIADMISNEKAPKTYFGFDELGVDFLLVDEAHNYKNFGIETKTSMFGISQKGSAKCNCMMRKVKCVQKMGGKVVFATGTPITNSLTDIFVMQSYLQYGELSVLNLASFDGWIGMFAEKQLQFEIDVDTSNYRMVGRFSKFHNMEILTTLLSGIADFHSMENDGNVPEAIYKNEIIPKTEGLKKYLLEISRRADNVRGGYTKRIDDNMLKITTDGRKAALDLRLADSQASFTEQSKVFRCACNIKRIYDETQEHKGTQLVFCDISTPKPGFNLYDDLRSLLVDLGIPYEEIAFVHDAISEKQREYLFNCVKEGYIRVIIGSTAKLGLGVNIQDRLKALHDLDVPWRPADVIQRHGRILRQGNSNKQVYIYRYIAAESFDAYSWQLLETKINFISKILEGSYSDQICSDVDSTVLKYGEVKALAVGDPLLKERVEKVNEMSRIRVLQRTEEARLSDLRTDLIGLQRQVEDQDERISRCQDNIVRFETNKRDYSVEERKGLREKLFALVCKNWLQSSERIAFTYQGFDVVLPANVMQDRPFLYVRGNGEYVVELGDLKEKGLLPRLDNCLLDLPKRLIRLQDAKEITLKKIQVIEKELKGQSNFAERLQALKQELEEIDQKLKENRKSA